MYQQTLTRSLPLQQLTEIEKDSRYVFNIDDRLPHYAKLPFIVRIKCAYIQLLLIGFASIAVLLFKMIHCIEINGESACMLKLQLYVLHDCRKLLWLLLQVGLCHFVFRFLLHVIFYGIAKLHQTNLFL